MEYTSVLENQVYDFILVFARVSAIVAFAPIFGAKSVPNQVKAMVAFSFAIVFTGILSPLDAPVEATSGGLLIQMAGEAVIGAAIGFASALIFEIIIFAGYIMDYMIGFGFINIVDPQSGSSISIFAFFYSLFGLILFILVDGHHVLIELMIRSYELIPVFGGSVNDYSIAYLSRMTGSIFYVGFQLAAPIFVIMFLVDFTLGMIGKAVPQFQILVVGFPIKISIGLVCIGLAMKPIAAFILGMIDGYRESLLWLLKYWGSQP